LLKRYLAVGIIILFIVSAATPLVIGYDAEIANKEFMDDMAFDCYDRYNSSRVSYYREYFLGCSSYGDLVSDRVDFLEESDVKKLTEIVEIEPNVKSVDGPMDSAWPMHGFDAQSTGRSPYKTVAITNVEKWRVYLENSGDAGVIVDNDGIIYVCDRRGNFSAIYPNGTLKWRLDMNQHSCDFGNSPAIDENGIIYVGGPDLGLVAINPDGTILWKIGANHFDLVDMVDSSPVIGADGTIYCAFNNYGDDDYALLRAINPNGTIKWSFQTQHVVQSSPAIGLDGDIIFGSHDGCIYSIYPSNGTLKWKYDTGHWVHGSPTIGSDGTIYCGSDSHYLYALYPENGTLKWQVSTAGGAMRSSPSLDKDDTLYFGTTDKFWAIYSNGTVKWTFSPKKYSGVWGSTAAISDDGVIYFGFEKRYFYPEGGWIFALDLNGNELWRKTISNDFISSSPCIGPDGTVYICSSSSKIVDNGYVEFIGYLHAFAGDVNNPPASPTITGPTSGKAGEYHRYTFQTTDPDGHEIYYYVDWGDDTSTHVWVGPYNSGEALSLDHLYTFEGTYIIKAKAKDEYDESDWATLEVSMPKDKPYVNTPFLRFLQNHPYLFPVLKYLLRL
jgi:outer membrane protein assembly factor BamB